MQEHQGDFQQVAFFSSKNRTGRLRFLTHCFYIGICAVTALPLALMHDLLAPWLANVLSYVISVLLTGLCALAATHRLRDLNQSPWFAVGVIIPYLNLLFVFLLAILPGTKGPNHYGKPPPPNTLWHWIAPALLIVGGCALFIFAIIMVNEFLTHLPDQ